MNSIGAGTVGLGTAAVRKVRERGLGYVASTATGICVGCSRLVKSTKKNDKGAVGHAWFCRSKKRPGAGKFLCWSGQAVKGTVYTPPWCPEEHEVTW